MSPAEYLTIPVQIRDTTPIFKEWPKISRLSRDVVVTEKIDGSCGVVYFDDDLRMLVGNRNRWLTEKEDNFGFFKWATEHEDELRELGKGHHYGEWWGSGIQRGYGLKNGERHFSLFNTGRWVGYWTAQFGEVVGQLPEGMAYAPACCRVVPVLCRGEFDTTMIENTLDALDRWGSVASKGFMKPEGIVIYHTAANMMFKKTCVDDEKRKSEA